MADFFVSTVIFLFPVYLIVAFLLIRLIIVKILYPIFKLVSDKISKRIEPFKFEEKEDHQFITQLESESDREIEQNPLLIVFKMILIAMVTSVIGVFFFKYVAENL